MAYRQTEEAAAGAGARPDRAIALWRNNAPDEIEITDLSAAQPEIVEREPEPAPMSVSPAPLPSLGLQARIRLDDAEFHRAYLRGLALSWGNLWLALGVMAAAGAVFSAFMVQPLLGFAAGAALGATAYLFIASLNGLRLDFEHERKLAQIHRTARLGAERVRIDDPALMRGALADVLSEWMHGALLLRRLRQTSFWYRAAIGAEIALALFGVALFVWLSPLSQGATALLAVAALLLTAYHGWREMRAGRERGLACALGEDLDPTEALSDRVILLLEEVRDLRRRGERR